MAHLGRWLPLVVFGVVVTGCPATQTKEPIGLAHLVSQTGPDRDLGRQAQQAVLLAVEELNAADKLILGRSLLVHNIDTRGDTETAQGETVRVLTLQKIVAVIAGPDANTAEQVVRTAHSYSATAVIVPGELAETPTSDGAVVLGADPRQRGQLLARFASQELKAKRVVVLTDKCAPVEKAVEKATLEQPSHEGPRADNRSPVAQRVAAGFFEEWPRAAPASAEEWPILDLAMEKDLVQRLADAKPDVVLVCSSAANLVKLRGQCIAAKFAAPLLYGGEDVGVRPVQTDTPGPDVYVATIFTTAALTEKGAAFAKKYEERFHEPPDLTAIQAYDAIRLLAETMQRLNSASGEDLHKDLAKIEKFESLLGPVVWKDHVARRRVFVVRLHDKETTVAKSVNADD